MDIGKLIERLRTESLYADKASLEIMDLCMEAATALSTLQAENEKLRAELEQVREKNAGLALALLTECAPNPDCLGDNEWRAIRAELEQVKAKRDAAVSDLETVMAYGDGNLDTCTFCKNGQCYERGGTKLCNPGWRGQKED